MFGLEPDNTKDTNFHTLPPDPEEEDKSIIRSSQAPISLAIDSVKAGTFASEGADIVVFCGMFELQFEQVVSTFEVHWALSTPPFNSQISLTLKDDDLIEEIPREEDVIHTQRNEEGGKEEEMEVNSEPQFKTPTPFVGEVKVTATWLPSEANCALLTRGGDKGSSTPFTTNTSPAGNTTLYPSLDEPLNEMFKR
jgi:hypothetical protein